MPNRDIDLRTITADHVREAMRRLDDGMPHPFGQPTKYVVEQDGRQYPPKAVVGIAYRVATGTTVGPSDFKGGKATDDANGILKRLGFVVKPIDGGRGEDWSEDEVRLIVADYFAMLLADLVGQPYSKTAHRRQLITRLNGRSEASVEFKHRNISAALAELAQPYIPGYKPAVNFQRSQLVPAIEDYLDTHPDQFANQQIIAAIEPADPEQLLPSTTAAFENPPDEILLPAQGEPWKSRRGRRTDFAQLDERNRKLGQVGNASWSNWNACG